MGNTQGRKNAEVLPGIHMSRGVIFKAGLLGLYIAALCLPLYVFFHDRGGTAFLHMADLRDSLRLVFPLLGLYAFTFVTWQVLIATNLRWLRKLWPRVINFHRFQGGFALLFAVLHPTFILIGFGLANYLHFRFVSPNLRWWLLPSYTALTILLLTVTTAFLAWQGMNIPWWRKLHRLNYLVFALVWLHSWFIGTDTRTRLLRWIWIVYLLLVTVSVIGKYRSRFARSKLNLGIIKSLNISRLFRSKHSVSNS
jgi:predicted ferric reductase